MVTGTKEWASSNVNICNGCSHDCRYCYAKSNADRYKRRTKDDWHIERVNHKMVDKGYRKREGTIMFPTSHDITPAILVPCLDVLEKMLRAGNRVLIVSKPHLECIEVLCYWLHNYREQVLFRFTITAQDDSILRFWEPNAPSYAERLAALKHAYEKRFETSVSIEPMLDSENIEALVRDLEPYITNSIWIGKMNQIRVRVNSDGPETEAAIRHIEAGQTDERIRRIYVDLKDHPIIKWKDSIKQVVGLDLAQEPGLDE